MGIWQKIKSTVKKWLGGGSKSAKATPPRTRVTHSNPQARNQTQVSRGRGRVVVDVDDEKEKKRVERENVFKAIRRETKDITASLKKESAPDPKVEAAKKSRAEMRKKLDAKKQERKEWHEATNNRFNVGEKGISEEERKRRRQNVKTRAWDEKTAVKEAEHTMKWHGKEESFARGALSGVTFGASDLAAKKLTKGEAKKAEEVYQKNKHKGYEVAGEIVGSLASFGGTAGATEKAAAKLTSKVAPKAAARLAEKEVIKGVAKRSVEKAVRKGVVKEASEELIKQVGKDKAAKIVNALGADVVQNLTTGAIYDINRASAEHEVGSEDWWKELGTSAALNFGVTGAVTGASALRGGKRLVKEAANKLAVREGVRRVGRATANDTRRIAPKIGESIEDRIARVNAERLGRNADVPRGTVEFPPRNNSTIDVINPDLERGRGLVEIGKPEEGIDVINPNARTVEPPKTAPEPFKAAEEPPKVVAPKPRTTEPTQAVTEMATPDKNLAEPVVTIGNGKRTYKWRLWDDYGDVSEIITVKANKASEAAEYAGEYGLTKGLRWSRNITNASAEVAETTARQTASPAVNNDATWREALADADDFKGFINANAKNPDVKAFVKSDGIDGLEKLWRDSRIAKNKQNIHEISLEESNEILGRSLPDSTRLEWFQNENSKIKPKLAHYIARDPDVINAGMTVAYHNYADSALGTPMSFDEWLITPQKMYRDTHGQELLSDDIFSAFTPDRRVAEKFAGKSADAHIEEITVRPIDTLGGYALSGEQEILVPREVIENARQATKTADEAIEGYNPQAAENIREHLATPPEPRATEPRLYVAPDGLQMNAETGEVVGGRMEDEYGYLLDPRTGEVLSGSASNQKERLDAIIYKVRNKQPLNENERTFLGNYYESVATPARERDDDIVSIASARMMEVAEDISRREGISYEEALDKAYVNAIVGNGLEPKVPAGESDDVLLDAITEYNRRTREQARAAQPTARTVAEQYNLDDVIPFSAVDEPMPSTNPAQTAENELREGMERRVRELAEQETRNADEAAEGIRVNNVAEDEPISGNLPSGVNQIRSAYEYNNGEKIEGGTLTKWSEAWKALNEYAASHATGEKNRMSKVSITQLNAMDSEAERELRQRLADSGELNYDAIDTPELYDKIAKQMRDDADRWIKDMIEINEGGALDFRSTPEWQARVQYILGTVDPSADPASEIAYTEAFKLAQNISSKGGQVLNLRRNFVHLTPMGKRDAILDDFINILYNSKGFQKNHPKMSSLGYFDKREYIRKILTDDEAISAGVEKLVKSKDVDEVSEAFTELMLNVNKKNPKTRFDVLQELRYLNMLGNPKTHIRNALGSGFFGPIRQISNAIRAGIEEPITRYASNQAGVNLQTVRHGGISLGAAKEAWVKNPTTEAGKAAKEAFDNVKAEMLGSLKYENQMYTGRGKTVAGKMLDTLSDFNSHLLSKEDDFFKEKAFRENYIKSYNRYLKDGKPITDKIKKRIEQSAMEEAQIATFNEYNELAKFLANITRKASDANASTFQRWGGRTVNAVIPFTKVPANLMKQSMNYSPIGIAKGFAGIKDAARHGDAKALTKAIDELASGLTGTVIFALGMLLGKTTHNMFGFDTEFTTNAGKNAPDAKFKKDRGMQNYSVTFTDPETGQGRSFTLDWLVPTSAVFFSGVELANQLKSDDFDLMDFSGSWADIMSRLAEPVMETSMLSGLHSMLETMRGGYGGDDTKGAIHILLRETAQSYINSLVPTLLGQAARTGYKTDMQIAGDDDWEYFRNQLKSKAGLANTNILGEPLGADTDAYGNVKGEKKDTADYVKAGLKNFLSPANIQKVDFSQTDKEKLRVYEEAIKSGKDPEDMAYLFPKKQYKKKFDVAGEEIKMSNRDLSTYNQAKTTGGEEGMRYILENIMFNRQTLDSKGKKVPTAEAYTKAEKAALMEKFRGKSMREVEEWLYAQPEFKKATDAEKKRAIEGLWKLTKDTKAVASQRVGEQAVYAAQGKDVNEYNFKNEISEKRRTALETAIGMGLLTYEEAVDFARNAGKTYYYENEDGGYASTYYNKKEMIEYLIEKGYSYEKAEALFNAFKNSRAKPYSGNNLSSGRRGWGGRGWRHYGHGGGGGGPKAKALKQSDFKATKRTYKDTASMLKTSGSSTSRSKGLSTASPVKVTPPKVRFKKYDV